MEDLVVELDGRGMETDDPGEHIFINIARDMMADPGLSLQTASQRLSWDPGRERWVLARIRGGKLLGTYRHLAVAYLMLRGAE